MHGYIYVYTNNGYIANKPKEKEKKKRKEKKEKRKI